MATKKVYPFINAKIFDLEGKADGMDAVFDAREVESYLSYGKLGAVQVHFKSGWHLNFHLKLDQKVYPGDDLIKRIDMVQYSHFWHDNEDSTPNENEDED